MTKIVGLTALEVLDSRGNPTVRAAVHLDSGHQGVAMVPSGASTGSFEAVELRDQDPARFHGQGVTRAVEYVEGEIARCLMGCDSLQQRMIDNRLIDLDGSPDKGRLGANAILAASLATARAAAQVAHRPLYVYLRELYGQVPSKWIMPVPQINILNGGAHATNGIDFQEFMILPVGAACFSEAIRMGAEVFHSLKGILARRGMVTAVGDEGGFAPNLESNLACIEVVSDAVVEAGYQLGTDIVLGLDVASTEIYHDNYYRLNAEGLSLDAEGMVAYLEKWCDRFPLVTIEDGMAENDWAGWVALTSRLGGRVQLTGDDLFVTNKERLGKGIKTNAANAILIKPNQIGTLSETLDAIEMAQEAGFGITISHRSGETEDTTIADLAVATGAGQIKTGSLCRSERVAKYNRLLEIERELGGHGSYPGIAALAGSGGAPASE
ncbi:MAG: phosphopyruvate hydratase [Arenicellales bacterium]|jgi:enolase|nr:phosphopyruvate hydratase [Arenicellales bacterium]